MIYRYRVYIEDLMHPLSAVHFCSRWAHPEYAGEDACFALWDSYLAILNESIIVVSSYPSDTRARFRVALDMEPRFKCHPIRKHENA